MAPFNKKKEGKKKNKGPKGKRARAKAKLERQWGETADESQLPQVRRGKSRLLQHQGARSSSSTVQKRLTHDNDDENSDMDVYVSSDESDDEHDGGALSSLLQSISNESRKPRQQAERISHQDDHSSHSSESESDSEISVRDDYEMECQADEESHVKDESDDSNVHGDDNVDIDPFSSHFNREPLSEKQLSHTMTESRKNRKVSLAGLDSSLELQLNEGSEMEDEVTSLFACNRKVLQLAWKRVNAPVLRGNTKNKQSLSSLQSALYPSIATYKDAFIAAETREVSTKRVVLACDCRYYACRLSPFTSSES